MFVDQLLNDLSDSEKQMAVLAFGNPIFVRIAKAHLDFFINRMTSLDINDESFKRDYEFAKKQLAGWQEILRFAAQHTPNGTDWGREFERLITQSGGHVNAN